MSDKVAFDEAGFLLDATQWSEALANELARADGLNQLSELHLEILRSLRTHYFLHHGLPSMHHVCHRHHLEAHCIDHLFNNSEREAWRLAGLPNPGSEALAYMH